MADENIDINMRLIMDQAAKENVKRQLQQMQEYIPAFQPNPFAWPDDKTLGTGFAKMKKEHKVTAEQAGKNWEKFWLKYQQAAERAQARVRTLQNQQLIYTSRSLKNLSDTMSITSRAMVVSGAALIAGTFGFAAKYVKDAKVATDTTRAWTAETDKLARLQARAGESIAKQVLPYLKQAVQFAETATGFIEQHPEVVRAALNTGLVLTTLGTIGLLLSKGIKVVADVAYIAGATGQIKAAQVQLEASINQLAAAGIQAKTSKFGGFTGLGGAVKGALSGAGAALAATVAATLTAMGLGFLAGRTYYDKIIAEREGLATSGQIFTGGAYLLGTKLFSRIARDDAEQAERKSIILAAIIGKLTRTIDESSPLWQRAANYIKGAAETVTVAIGQLRGSEHETEVVEAFMRFREDIAKLEEETGRKRVEVIEDAARRIENAERQWAERIADIWADYRSRVSEITGDYLRQQQRDEEDYARRRQEMEIDASRQIQRTREELLERLRKLEQDHQDRMYDLVGARDALGIVREKRDYARKVEEEKRNTNEEIQRIKEDTQRRLEELDRQHALEAQRRYEDYQRQLADAAEQRDKRLEEAKADFEREQEEIRRQQEEKLKELDLFHQREMARIRQDFVDRVNDLDASLTGERGLRQYYYNQMLTDAEKWLIEYRRQLAEGMLPYIPQHAAGGYTSGIVRTGELGEEFILSNRSTRALEKMIGGRLNQQNVISAIRGGQIVWNDMRRFSGEYTSSMRREIRRDTSAAIGDFLEKAFG